MHEATVASRLIEMDRLLKHKFSNLWVSVRKAFLDLDTDKDGYIVAEDIQRYFGDEDNLDMVDLRRLMLEKQGTITCEQVGKCSSGMVGALSCHDFTNWVGEAIHLREGFYFRHDSLMNPNSTHHLAERQKRQGLNIEQQQVTQTSNLEELLEII